MVVAHVGDTGILMGQAVVDLNRKIDLAAGIGLESEVQICQPWSWRSAGRAETRQERMIRDPERVDRHMELILALIGSARLPIW